MKQMVVSSFWLVKAEMVPQLNLSDSYTCNSHYSDDAGKLVMWLLAFVHSPNNTLFAWEFSADESGFLVQATEMRWELPPSHN